MTESMTESMTERSWLSAHLHLHEPLAPALYGAAGDRVILGLVAPFARRALDAGWADRFFFVRYRTAGPHVRFRLHGPPPVLEATVRPALAAAAAGDEAIREVVWEAYEPEDERYGGAAGVAVAEELFDASSRAALRMLAKLPAALPGDRSARLGKGLLAALAMLAVFAGDRQPAADLMTNFSSGMLYQFVGEEAEHGAWNRVFEQGYEAQSAALADFVSAAWQAFDDPSGSALPPEVAVLRGDLERVRRRLEALLAGGDLHRRVGRSRSWHAAVLTRLVPSYLHMMNNRLGVQPSEESYLASVTAAALGAGRRRETA